MTPRERLSAPSIFETKKNNFFFGFAFFYLKTFSVFEEESDRSLMRKSINGHKKTKKKTKNELNFLVFFWFLNCNFVFLARERRKINWECGTG
jgi:hypothetical protein